MISKVAVRIAQEKGIKVIAHGCTGKGNDQVSSPFPPFLFGRSPSPYPPRRFDSKVTSPLWIQR